MSELANFPWAAISAIGLTLGYLIRASMDYARQKKEAEGMLTREEYLRDQSEREDRIMLKVRQLILDLTGD